MGSGEDSPPPSPRGPAAAAAAEEEETAVPGGEVTPPSGGPSVMSSASGVTVERQGEGEVTPPSPSQRLQSITTPAAAAAAGATGALDGGPGHGITPSGGGRHVTLTPPPPPPSGPPPGAMRAPQLQPIPRPATRRPAGNNGRWIERMINANYYRMVVERPVEVWQYQVIILKKNLSADESRWMEVKNRRTRRQLLTAALEEQGIFQRSTTVFDNSKALYTVGPGPFQSKELTHIPAQDNSSNGESGRADSGFCIRLQLDGKIDLGVLMPAESGRGASDQVEKALQVLNLVIQENAQAMGGCVPVGQSLFHKQFGSSPIGGALLNIPGFFTSVRRVQATLALNIDLSNAAFIAPGPVLDALCNLFRKDLRRIPRMTPDECRKAKKFLKGLQITVELRARNGNHYRLQSVFSVTVESADMLRFEMKEGEQMREMTVTQYYSEKYGLELRGRTLPCIDVGKRSRPVYIPLEFCVILPMQPYKGKLLPEQASSQIKETCISAPARWTDTEKMIAKNRYDLDPILKTFSVKVLPGMAPVQARILAPPVMSFGNNYQDTPMNGQWNLNTKTVYQGVTINAWMVVALNSEVHPRVFDDMARSWHKKGIRINPERKFLAQARPDEYCSPQEMKACLEGLLDRATANLNMRPDLMICVLPSSNSPMYASLKKVCDTELGIVTQCINASKEKRFNDQYWANVGLKVNVKLGGINTLLEQEKRSAIPKFSDKPTIVIGMDVSHGSAMERDNFSIAAVVGSKEWPLLSKYSCRTRSQKCRLETIVGLYEEIDTGNGNIQRGGMLKEVLEEYRATSRGCLPQRIIIYRDGVSESQFGAVLNVELSAIRQALSIFDEPGRRYSPAITFIVVHKKHHTRFFPEPRHYREGGKGQNILPGTVVDRIVCSPDQFDFYLCSHQGIQGTSRAAHYHVLYDDNNFNEDEIQSFTNNLCYTYARCTRAVSVVPPVYYAHLAAIHFRRYLDAERGDAGSVLSGGSGDIDPSLEPRPLPLVKEAVRRNMFFC
ncbi:hypothetical protein CBR_g29701 [Chara braunii]|uniref:Uncharacterized protein n=1 Tax=Chara braunii TaxID=69332 RepID=A0A388LB92_CHABU|nr:hypothetical protein CBR_g29701 [Chara braunii]|eukprot:GBG79554.1 hypothetical protein CBR_g29701 [Chara braunii]